MLSLENFEKYFSKKIVERGQVYFENKAVIELYELKNGVWTASVEGQGDNYNVKIQLKNQNVVSSDCNCPYDETCKHIVAALYAIKIKKSNSKLPEDVKTDHKKVPLWELLDKISYEELKEYILIMSNRSKDFKLDFEIYFAAKIPQADATEKYEQWIKNIIKRNTTKGFMTYKNTKGYVNDIDMVLEMARDLINKRNYAEALAIVKVLLPTSIEVVNCAEGHSNSVYDVVCETIDIIEDFVISDEVSPSVLEQVFAFLSTEIKNKDYSNLGDFSDNLLEIIYNLAQRMEKHTEFLQLLDELIVIFNDKYEDSFRSALREMKSKYIKKIENDDEDDD